MGVMFFDLAQQATSNHHQSSKLSNLNRQIGFTRLDMELVQDMTDYYVAFTISSARRRSINLPFIRKTARSVCTSIGWAAVGYGRDPNSSSYSQCIRPLVQNLGDSRAETISPL
jgi:hypothetical protein